MPLGAFKAALMGTAGVSTETVVLLSSQTASNSATLDFTSGITSTYGEYIFKFYNVGPATDQVDFHFQVNAAEEAGAFDSNTGGFKFEGPSQTFMRIFTKNRSVGIGNFNYAKPPSAKLHVSASGNQATGSLFKVTGTNDIFTVSGSGNVGIGVSLPGQTLTIKDSVLQEVKLIHLDLQEVVGK